MDRSRACVFDIRILEERETTFRNNANVRPKREPSFVSRSETDMRNCVRKTIGTITFDDRIGAKDEVYDYKQGTLQTIKGGSLRSHEGDIYVVLSENCIIFLIMKYTTDNKGRVLVGNFLIIFIDLWRLSYLIFFFLSFPIFFLLPFFFIYDSPFVAYKKIILKKCRKGGNSRGEKKSFFAKRIRRYDDDESEI